jgi:hypothetical protein
VGAGGSEQTAEFAASQAGVSLVCFIAHQLFGAEAIDVDDEVNGRMTLEIVTARVTTGCRAAMAH